MKHIRISRYQYLFSKGYKPNWSTEAFAMKIENLQHYGNKRQKITLMKPLELFMKQNCKITGKLFIDLKRRKWKKAIKFMLNRKDMTILLIVKLMSQIFYKNESMFF